MLLVPVAPFGSTRVVGTVPSAFKRMKPDKPPGILVPPVRALISSTFTRMLAVVLLDTANNVRDTPACGPIAISMLFCGKAIPLLVVGNGGGGTGLGGTNCENDANPFTG